MKHSSDRHDKRSRKENNHKKGRPSRDQGGAFGGSSNNARAVIALNAVPSQAVCARCLRKMSPHKKGQVDLQTHGANRCVEWPHVPQSLRDPLESGPGACQKQELHAILMECRCAFVCASGVIAKSCPPRTCEVAITSEIKSPLPKPDEISICDEGIEWGPLS